MHKDFYASGFLYHYPTQQILLQQSPSSDTTLWELFGGKGDAEDDVKEVFQRIIAEELDCHLDTAVILPVFDYPDRERNMRHFMHYAQVEENDFTSLSGNTLQWFTFKQIQRTPMSKQTRQNIIVAQRVINLAQRVAQEAPV